MNRWKIGPTPQRGQRRRQPRATACHAVGSITGWASVAARMHSSLAHQLAQVSFAPRASHLIEMLEQRDRPLAREPDAILELGHAELGPTGLGQLGGQAVELALRDEEALADARDALALVEITEHRVELLLGGADGRCDLRRGRRR